MKRAVKLFLFACLIGLLSLPAFAQEHNMNMATDAVKINITMSDYHFVIEGQKPDQPLQLQAGQIYQITFSNKSESKMAHEILFGKSVTKLSNFAHTYTDPLLSNVPVMITSAADSDFMVNVAGLDQLQIGVDKALTIEFTLPDTKVGDWELGCFEYLSMTDSDDHPGPTHYDVGMHLPITVSAAMHM